MMTIHYETEYDETGEPITSVTALVQDGRSCGPYSLTRDYHGMEGHQAVSRYLGDLLVRGQEIHPDPLD